MFRFFIVAVIVIVALLVPTSLALAAIRGDADGNGSVNMGDVTKVERIICGLDAATPGADATGEGQINMGDVVKIERLILGMDPPVIF